MTLEVMTKQCTKCTAIKGIDDFYRKNKNEEQRHSLCKSCQQEQNKVTGRRWRLNNPTAAREYYDAHKEKINAQRRARIAANPEFYRERQQHHREKFRDKINARRRKTWVLWQYGITRQEKEGILLAQGGKCAACNAVAPGGKGVWHTDHDHACCPRGKKTCGQCIRGILCSSCNTALGLVNDNVETLKGMISYLEKMENNLSVSLRPRELQDVIGHDAVVRAIKKLLDDRKQPRSWLFSGIPGVGKTTLARILSRLVQGEGFAGDPDVIELNGADRNGVEAAREIVSQCEYQPLTGLVRVIIIDEAQKLTDAAQQCLLKPLESESSSTVFVFCTTEPAKLLPALRSRCVSFHLSPLNEKQTTTLVLRAVAHVGFKPDIAPLSVALAGVGVAVPRDVLMVCERYFAGIPADRAVQKTDEPVEYWEIAKSTWRGDWEKTSQLLKSLKSADVRGLRSVIAAWGKKMLLEPSNHISHQLIAECLTGLAQYQIYEDGIAFAVTTAILFKICKKMS